MPNRYIQIERWTIGEPRYVVFEELGEYTFHPEILEVSYITHEKLGFILLMEDKSTHLLKLYE